MAETSSFPPSNEAQKPEAIPEVKAREKRRDKHKRNENGLTEKQQQAFDAIVALHREGAEITPAVLAKRLGCIAQNVVARVDSLHEMGMIHSPRSKVAGVKRLIYIMAEHPVEEVSDVTITPLEELDDDEDRELKTAPVAAPIQQASAPVSAEWQFPDYLPPPPRKPVRTRGRGYVVDGVPFYGPEDVMLKGDA